MRMHLQGLAEEFIDTIAGEQLLERKAGQDRARRQDTDGYQHRQRSFMRGLVMLLVVRLAEEGLEDEAPGVKRGQASRDHRHQVTIERQRVVRYVGGLDDRVL